MPAQDQEMANYSSDEDGSSNWDSDDSEMMANGGNKFGSTKTSKKGQYEFTFMQDAAFLAMTEDQKDKFLEIQRALRVKRQ